MIAAVQWKASEETVPDEKESFIALGPASFGFRCSGANIDQGGYMTGRHYGLWGQGRNLGPEASSATASASRAARSVPAASTAKLAFSGTRPESCRELAAGDWRQRFLAGEPPSGVTNTLQGGTSSIAFSYRIVAKRKDIKRHTRLPRSTRPSSRCPSGRHRMRPRRHHREAI
jgi:hypothetical protein